MASGRFGARVGVTTEGAEERGDFPEADLLRLLRDMKRRGAVGLV